MRQLSDFLKTHIGEAGFILTIGLILAGAGLAFFIFTIRHNPGLIKGTGIILLLITGLVLAWQIRIPVERIHILEYGVLGWFAGRDLIRKDTKVRGIILASIFTVIIGTFDELFQLILPYRFFDLRDIGFNTLGGAWGIVLYLLSHFI
jgi:glycopeptide antibiotics resistance protein